MNKTILLFLFPLIPAFSFSQNVGIGTTNPTAKLHVLGNVKIADGTQGANKVLTSDNEGNATWQAIGGNNVWVKDAENNISNTNEGEVRLTTMLRSNLQYGSAASFETTYPFSEAPTVSITNSTYGSPLYIRKTGGGFGSVIDCYGEGLSHPALTIKFDVGESQLANSSAFDVSVKSNNSSARIYQEGSGSGLVVSTNNYTNDQSAFVAVTAGTGYATQIQGGKGALIYTEGGFSNPQLTVYSQQNDFSRILFSRNVDISNATELKAWTIAAYRGTTAADDVFNIFNERTATDVLSIRGDNNAYFAGEVRAQGILLTSDERLKKNIQPINAVMDKLNLLNAYTYQWKNDAQPQNEQIGFLAQEVEKQFPQLVNTDENGTKSVAYMNMVPVLLEAVKEQQKMIEALKKEVKEFKKFKRID